MSDPESDFKRLMEGVGSGSENAAWEIVETYGESLRRAVRKVLHTKLRSKFDSLDFVQIVWKSFFEMDHTAVRCDTPQQLAKLLYKMAYTKVIAESRKRLRASYDVNREGGFDDLTDNPQLADRNQPLPLDVVIARERWNQLLDNQPEHYREIVRLRLCGYSYVSVAKELGLDAQTVRRFLKKLVAVAAD
jgi:RNA polymerase sigma factor (sigma-70 family)